MLCGGGGGGDGGGEGGSGEDHVQHARSQPDRCGKQELWWGLEVVVVMVSVEVGRTVYNMHEVNQMGAENRNCGGGGGVGEGGDDHVEHARS